MSKLRFHDVFLWFKENGETRIASMGGASNAYVVARNTGRVPAWCPRGTPAYAAAKAGLWKRKRNESSR